MTWTDLAQLITALAAMGAVLLGWRNGHKIDSVHIDINSRMTELLSVTKTEANLTGRAELRQEQKDHHRG